MSLNYLAVLEAIAEKLAEVAADRVVSRQYKDFTDRTREQLEAGIYTLVPTGIRDYPYERADDDGARTELPVFTFLLTGQGVLADDATGEEIDAAEFAMVEEIEALANAVVEDDSLAEHDQLCRLRLLGIEQSSQMEAPYYWIAARLELSNLL